MTSYGLSQQVDDLEAAREALGYERISLVGESVGTRTAMMHAWRYPERINQSVMIAANPPGNFVWDPATTDEPDHARYAEYCSKDAGCRGRTADLAATMRSTEIRAMALPPDRGGQRSGRLPLRTHGNDGGERAAPCPDDDRLVVVRGRGRRGGSGSSRCWRTSPSRRRSSGGSTRAPRASMSRSRTSTSLQRDSEGLEPGLRGVGLVRVGRGPAERGLAGRTGRGRVRRGAAVGGGAARRGR